MKYPEGQKSTAVRAMLLLEERLFNADLCKDWDLAIDEGVYTLYKRASNWKKKFTQNNYTVYKICVVCLM